MQKNSNLLILLALGLIWSSFALFTKISAEGVSPYFVVFSRLVLGGVLLYAVLLFKGKKLFVPKNFKYYAIVGFFNSAFPFTLFALSATALDSGVVAILDGTVPMFEVLISVLILRKHVGKNAVLGVIFGVVGTAVTSFSDIGNSEFTWIQGRAVTFIMIATACYAGISLYISAKCKHIEPIVLATGSVMFSALLLSPSLFFTNIALINAKTATSLLGLGLLCTGLAYLFYFKLVAEEGARTAVSVVLLIPVFGTIFGAMFLGEVITIGKIVGCITILASMKFILNLSAKNFKFKNAPLV